MHDLRRRELSRAHERQLLHQSRLLVVLSATASVLAIGLLDHPFHLFPHRRILRGLVEDRHVWLRRRRRLLQPRIVGWLRRPRLGARVDGERVVELVEQVRILYLDGCVKV